MEATVVKVGLDTSGAICDKATQAVLDEYYRKGWELAGTIMDPTSCPLLIFHRERRRRP